MSTLRRSHWIFAGIFLFVFFISSTLLVLIDFVPEPKNETKTVREAAPPHGVVEAPVRIVIPSIGVDTSIENPTSVSLSDLDDALLRGAVRYPGSALLGEEAPMFLFGHQSYLPVVRNQAFKAFNDLQKLDAGDEIMVYGDSGVYTYRVDSLERVEAAEALIPLTPGTRSLTLSTCNSFGDPGERYVISASFVSYSLH